MAKKGVATTLKTAGTAVAASPRKSTPIAVELPPETAKSAEQADIAPAGRTAPTHEEIAHRAYILWTQGNPGGEADHWLQAERELHG